MGQPGVLRTRIVPTRALDDEPVRVGFAKELLGEFDPPSEVSTGRAFVAVGTGISIGLYFQWAYPSSRVRV